MSSPTLFFVFKIFWTIVCPLHFHVNISISLAMSTKSLLKFLLGEGAHGEILQSKHFGRNATGISYVTLSSIGGT